jgi:hypothetical protein
VVFSWITRRIIHVKVRDMNCTFRAFRREVLDDMHLYGDMYRFLPALAYRQGFRVQELEVRHLREWGGAGCSGSASTRGGCSTWSGCSSWRSSR